jgi:hypothetical protein
MAFYPGSGCSRMLFSLINIPFYEYLRLHKAGFEWFAVQNLYVPFQFPEICDYNLAGHFSILSFVIV